MLPWQIAQVEELRREMGHDWWPYGFASNQRVLETFLRYHHEQGLSKRKLQPEALFAPNYTESRRRFREAAAALGLELEAHSIGHTGPDGVDLTIDVAIAPGAQSNNTLVISSGLHGIEGFLGSAVQLALLRAWRGQIPGVPAVRCVLLHALNPYGYAWRRRVNENNVDLNRNLLSDGEAFSGSPEGYSVLNDLLNPKRAPSRWEPVTLKFLQAIARFGMPALKQSVAAGQYDYPQGLFYGGDRPSRSNEILSTHYARWLADSRSVMHLDFHSGLGAWAACKLLVDYPLAASQQQRLSRWFGADTVECTDKPHVAYRTIAGVQKMQPWWYRLTGYGKAPKSPVAATTGFATDPAQPTRPPLQRHLVFTSFRATSGPSLCTPIENDFP